MWTRVQFAARGVVPAVDRLFASWRLSIGLMLVAVLYDVLLAGWAAKSPAQIIQNIAGLAPFWTVYALLLMNTAWCMWRRLPALRSQVRAQPLLSGARPDWERAAPPGEVREALRELGYAVRELGQGSVWGVRRRWAALGTYLFHGAFFLIALGFVATVLRREELKVFVAAGEEFTAAPEQILSSTGGGTGVRFSVEELSPAFWRDQLLFTELSAVVRLPDGELATTRINRPLWLGFGTFLRLSGFGYAPRFELLDRSDRVLESAFLKLNVFPPGKRDLFVMDQFPHRAYLEVYPDLELVDGRPSSRTLNLVKPGYRVNVFRGKVELGGAVLDGAEPFEFEGLRLRFPEIRYWGEFTIVRDAGAPVLFAGFLLGLLGLGWKLRGARAEVEWSAERGTIRGWGGPPPGGLT